MCGWMSLKKSLNGTGDLALRWEVARVWRLGRQTTYVIVSAQ
jgi:hypothetical protein